MSVSLLLCAAHSPMAIMFVPQRSRPSTQYFSISPSSQYHQWKSTFHKVIWHKHCFRKTPCQTSKLTTKLQNQVSATTGKRLSMQKIPDQKTKKNKKSGQTDSTRSEVENKTRKSADENLTQQTHQTHLEFFRNITQPHLLQRRSTKKHQKDRKSKRTSVETPVPARRQTRPQGERAHSASVQKLSRINSDPRPVGGRES